VTPRDRLLLAAARCYERAGLADDACRCFEGAQAWADAAALHERAARPMDAAAAWERAGRPVDAARCLEAAGHPELAAVAYTAGGDALSAAWIRTHALHDAAAARALLRGFVPAVADDALAQTLVLARCDAAGPAAPRAAQALRGAIARLSEASPARRARLATWAVAVADALGRPDLGILAHGAASPGDWDRWAATTLGEVPAPPWRDGGAAA
jgi:hypothetical protein